MAKMYYNLEEAIAKLGCAEEEFRGLIREGRLREFRDAGKLNYRVDEVDMLADSQDGVLQDAAPLDSGELALSDSAELELEPPEAQDAGDEVTPLSASGSVPGLSGSNAPIDLGSSDTGALELEDSAIGSVGADDSDLTGGSLSDSALTGSDTGAGTGADSGAGDAAAESGELKLAGEDEADKMSLGGSDAASFLAPSEDMAGGSDILSLDEVDKDAAEGLKKDDTVITNIGISVFDDDDLEIAADPMAKTLLTGGEDHLGLDGSGGGSGLLDLTRESDDTSLGAELLEGIDMGDTAETAAASVEGKPSESADEMEAAMPEPGMEPAAVGRTQMVGLVEPASPAFTGLLISATISLALVGASSVATSMDALPGYLQLLADEFWFFLGGMILAGGLFALIGFFVGRPSSGPKPPKQKKAKSKKGKKGKEAQKGEPETAELMEFPEEPQ